MKAKRLIAALLCFLLIGSMLPVNAFAANDIIGNKYTLTLDENWEGGTGQVIPNITSYELPSAARSGETFYGWVLSPDGNAKYNAGDTVTLSHDLTLYAVWHNVTDNGYYVIFDANGGIGTMESIWFGTQSNSPPATIPDCGFTRDGYTFKGWATSPDGAVAYLPGASYKSPDDLFLFAVWEQNDYHTVTVNNDGNGTATADKASYEKGETVTLTAAPDTGYHFKEWQSDDVTIADNSFTMPEKDVTVKAVFEADAPTTYTGTGWNLDADGVLHITGDIPESGFDLTDEQKGQVKSVVAVSGASISSGEALFSGFKNMTSADLSLLNTTGVTSMGGMFYNCSDLTSLDLSSFDTSSVNDMSSMFEGCGSLTSLDVSGFDTGSVNDMSSMFEGCSSLTSLDVSGFNTSSVTEMHHMFSDCSSLTSLDVSGFDTRSVMEMHLMFLGCSSLTALRITPDILRANADDISTDIVILLAMYTVNVQNDGNGTASANPAAAAEDETVTLTATPNAGYHFKEWQSSDVTVNNNSFTMPKKDVTVKAIFEADAPTTYTVTFNMNGHGTQVADQTVEDGNKATKPDDPAASGWTFGGWYTDMACNEAFDFTSAITANTTIYAKWTAAHTWDDGEVTTPATHMTEGVMTYTCTECGETKTETIDKLTEHAFDQETVSEQYLKSEATCTEAAVYYKSCECGEASETDTFTVGEAPGHDWDEGKVTTPATYEAEGVRTYTCRRCDDTKTEPIKKLRKHGPIDDFVTRLYTVCLDREPCDRELDHYFWEITENGMTGSEVTGKFIFSDEFCMKNYCDRHYVEALYKTFMGRTPGDDEIAYWAWQLQQGKTREEVFNGFLSSTEFAYFCAEAGIKVGGAVKFDNKGTRAGGRCTVDGCISAEGYDRFVRRIYNVTLDREPSQEELDAWVYNLIHGDYTARTASHEFLFSEEFISHDYADEVFVDYLYNAMMGRTPGTDEVNYWVWRFSTGVTREDAFSEFADSDEFALLCQDYGINCR